jgi:hypothetical protein
VRLLSSTPTATPRKPEFILMAGAGIATSTAADAMLTIKKNQLMKI